MTTGVMKSAISYRSAILGWKSNCRTALAARHDK
jgi:hypothetical protein